MNRTYNNYDLSKPVIPMAGSMLNNETKKLF